MAASSAVPEYRLRLPYVPRAIFKPYHARQQTAGIEVELAEAVEQVAAALLAEVGAHGDVAAAQADPEGGRHGHSDAHAALVAYLGERVDLMTRVC